MALLDAEPRSVAVVRLRTGLGDLLCGVPALRALRARLPDAHVALVTFAEMAPVVERQRPWVDELVAFPGWPGIPERPVDERAVGPWLASVRGRFDVAIQAYGMRPAANEVTAAMGAARCGGFFAPGAWAPPDLDSWLPYPSRDHEVRRHLRLMELLGAPQAGAVPPGTDPDAPFAAERLEFPLGAADEAEAAAAVPAGPYAVLHPGATSPSRRWAPERFAHVGDALAADGLAVAVTGVPSEREVVRSVVEGMRAPATELCGALSLGGFGALLRDAAVVVTNDTGTGHLCSALRTPSVTCFLSGDPVRWAPPDAGRHRVARASVECNPCEHLTCPIDHRCATRLGAARVAELARGAARGAVRSSA